jgi:hypothetical protein
LVATKKVLITPQILRSVLVQLFQTPTKFALEIFLFYFFARCWISSLPGLALPQEAADVDRFSLLACTGVVRESATPQQTTPLTHYKLLIAGYILGVRDGRVGLCPMHSGARLLFSFSLFLCNNHALNL